MARCARRSPWRACETRRLGTPMGSWCSLSERRSCAWPRRPSRVLGAAPDRRRSLARSGRSSPPRQPSSAGSRGAPRGAGRCRRRDGRGRPPRGGSPQTMHRPGQSGRQSGAIGSASEDRLADRRLEVELVVVGQAQRRRARRRPASGVPGREVDRRQVLLAGCRGASGIDDLAEAAAALERERGRAGPRRRGRRGWSATAGPDPSIGVGQAEVVAQVDRGRPGPGTRGRDSAPAARPRRPATFQVSGPSGRAGGHRGLGRLRRVLRLVGPPPSSVVEPASRSVERGRRAARRAARSPS